MLPLGQLADVMTRHPVTVHHSASMWTAWDRLRARRTGHLVVVDDHRRPVGVLDERTLALEWPPGPLGAHRTPVHTLLRDRLRRRVRGGDDVGAVARTMAGARADAVPMVDREGRLSGLITLWHVAELAAGGGRGEPPGGSTARPTGPAGTVIGAVTRCRAELLRAGVRRGPAGATEVRVRAQLSGTTADAGDGHGSGGSGVAGQSSSRAPSTAACSENRWSGWETLYPVSWATRARR